ncbi:hypothetical protein GC174_05565 [bacterium]|nr:hypothetical protein [bacterium]
MTKNNSGHDSIITFTSDFGTTDGYVGIVKGSISNINQDATIIDLAHEIKPFDVRAGAWIIYNSYRFFPAGTIHLVVVDPKVGSSQRRILLTNGEHHFVGPDSGVFSLVLNTRGDWTAYEIKNEIFFLQDISSSFHARDIFGPVAAHLSLGIEPHKFGPEIDSKSLNASAYRPAAISSSNIAGEVIYIDRFGNLITNIPNSAIPQAISSGWKLNITNEVIDEISLTYSSVPEGALLAFEGSHGFLEIAANQASAVKKLKASMGEPVVLC